MRSCLVLVTALLAVGPAAAAEDPLARALADTRRDGKPVLVLFAAEWCEPCTELEDQVIEHARGAALLAKVHLAAYDFESDLGQAAAHRHRVLQLPTSLILRPTPAGGLLEIDRVEGFNDVPSWMARIEKARVSPGPVGAACAAWKRQPAGSCALVECAAESLRGPDADAAAAWLAPCAAAKATSPAAIPAKLEAAKLMARYWLRLKDQPARCAEVAGRVWREHPTEKGAGGLAYWEARCLGRAGKPREAVLALDAYLARARLEGKRLAEARLMVADLLVHEKIAPERARKDLEAIIAADPKNDEPPYLLARLLRDTGRRAEARAAVAKARALAPKKALYRRFEAGLGN